MDSNYFVCTLGEASQFSEGRCYHDVNDLLDRQSRNNPDLPAVGFYRINSSNKSTKELQCEVISFKELQKGLQTAAEIISEKICLSAGQTVGLLCASSPEFLFIWLACIRLGHAVLLIAPECSPTGIAQLCHSCQVTVVIADEKHRELCIEATKQKINGQKVSMRCADSPFKGKDVFQTIKQPPLKEASKSTSRRLDIAYLHHTSGTSSGQPRAIAQSHQAAVGVLPMMDGQCKATFTTTPLYHGGPADIFRAWTSNAMIWLFPSNEMPITPSNIVRCLESSGIRARRNTLPQISFFTTVPYIIQMLAEDDSAVQWLQTMELVSVGGASLPKYTGDFLVSQGVNLVSRFGSAECGFLLSSHRDYCKDKYWSYLRLPCGPSRLKFEAREDGLSELIVLANWPHLAKSNRDDGSYATSDLFDPHPQLRNAWKYHSRSDSQLTLMTGKKFDPAPLEDTLVAATPSIAAALIFGNNKPYPGALIFRSEKEAKTCDKEIVRQVRIEMEMLNAASHSHARISDSMLVPMPFTVCPLEKSSKGTIQRVKADLRYRDEIESAYTRVSLEDYCPDEQLRDKVRMIILKTIPGKSKDLLDGTDLFSFGVDSTAGIKIRHGLQLLLEKGAAGLQPTIVEDCGSVEKLVEHILRVRHGTLENDRPPVDERDYMLALVEQYINFTDNSLACLSVNDIDVEDKQQETVVLTGATGLLGSHVLHMLTKDTTIKKVYCLVRSSGPDAASQRVEDALLQRQLHGVSGNPKITILQSTLGQEMLGLSSNMYDQIAREITVVIHLAWPVNFQMKLHSFVEDSIAGVRNLINLALASPNIDCPRFAFCSSVASSIGHKENIIPEQVFEDPSSASALGYSQSKWVAEQICQQAATKTRLRGKVSIFRVGQLSGNSITGIWNSKEAWPLMLSTVKFTGVLPEIAGEVLDWLPVDVAAKAIVEGAHYKWSERYVSVFHVVNDNTFPQWDTLLKWMDKKVPFQSISQLLWIEKLDNAVKQSPDHPAFHLLEHWRKAYHKSGEEMPSRKKFETKITKQALQVLRDIKPMDEAYFEKLWIWVDQNV
jgi:thioester reductase-like protein